MKVCLDLFGEGLKEELKTAYRSVVEAISEKDTNFLREIMEPKLIESLCSPSAPNLKLVNPEAKIGIQFGELKYIMFLPFIRGDLSDFYLSKGKMNEDVGISIFRATPLNKKRMPEIRNTLFIMEVIFKSKMKLV